ncbi:MAG: dihydropteroate synthase [Prevotella sp.]|jgi:dihydropteroate synthase|nr:dihydropteroate synthase [Prevotella sp.]
MNINIKGKLLNLSQPKVMGILNVTPDSFYEGSRKQTEPEILARVEEIVSQGGDIIDIGAQSTRPTSQPVGEQEEIKRLDYALNIIRKRYPDAVVSVDTFYASAARFCVEEYGADIVNDISGGEIDKNMFETVADLHVPYVLMHMRGQPSTMQQFTGYNNLLRDIFYWFSTKIADLHRLGVNDIIIDPGFGFSKNLQQNYELMSRLADFRIFKLPLLVGISRKSMIYTLLETTPTGSLNGTSVLNAFSLLNGANILRVHDVREAVETVKIVQQIKQ